MMNIYQKIEAFQAEVDFNRPSMALSLLKPILEELAAKLLSEEADPTIEAEPDDAVIEVEDLPVKKTVAKKAAASKTADSKTEEGTEAR